MTFRSTSYRWAACAALAATLAGCATTAALRNGRRAEDRQDYDQAVMDYQRALQLNPDSADVRTSLQRAKLRAAQDHFQRARRLAAIGRLDEALAEYQMAAEMNPSSGEIAEELRAAQNLLRAKVATNRDGKTELQALVDRMRDQPSPGLSAPQDPLPDSWTFRNASNQDVLRALAQVANVNVIFDPAFRPTPISIDVRNQTFDQALQAITASTQNFFRVTAPRTITIIPDTPAKRREYEQEIVRTFFLSNADLKETMDLLRIVIDARAIGSTAGTNAITIHDTPERIAAAARLIDVIDKARPEVMIDVELLEVNRTKLNEYGLQFASPPSGQGVPTGISGVADVNRAGLTLRDLKNLSENQILMTAVPSLYYRLLKSDTSTRVLANPQLRTQVGLAAQAKFGDEVPVPVTTFSPIATGGIAQQPITSYNYRTIGVNIDITPRAHLDNDVTLTLKLQVNSISGQGFGGLPTFGNREVTTQIRLKDGETNMLAGLIRDDERRSLDGIPGLSDLPLVGHIFGHSKNQRDQTDVILMLTPHIVRVLDLTEEDLRAFVVGPSTAGGAGGFSGPPNIGVPSQSVPGVGAPRDNDPPQPILPPTPPQPPAPQAPPGPAPAPPR